MLWPHITASCFSRISAIKLVWAVRIVLLHAALRKLCATLLCARSSWERCDFCGGNEPSKFLLFLRLWQKLEYPHVDLFLQKTWVFGKPNLEHWYLRKYIFSLNGFFVEIIGSSSATLLRRKSHFIGSLMVKWLDSEAMTFLMALSSPVLHCTIWSMIAVNYNWWCVIRAYYASRGFRVSHLLNFSLSNFPFL